MGKWGGASLPITWLLSFCLALPFVPPSEAQVAAPAAADRPWWVTAAASPDAGLRERDANELPGNASETEALQVLMLLLRDDEPGVKKAAVEGSVHFTNALDSIFDSLASATTDSDPATRTEAVKALAVLCDARCHATLGRAVADSNPEVASSAVAALAAIGRRTRRPATEILAGLKHSAASVRERTAAELAGLGPLAVFAAESLAAALQDPAHDVRLSAAKAFGRMGPSLAEPPAALLLSCRTESAADIRAESVRTLASAHPTESVLAILRTSLEDPARDVRLSAIEALGAAVDESTEVTAMLSAQATKGEIAIRLAALAALTRATSIADDSRRAARESLASSDSRLRIGGAAFFEARGESEDVEALVPLVRDPVADVRMAALRALGEIAGDPQKRSSLPTIEVDLALAEAGLAQLAVEDDVDVKRHLIRVLGRFNAYWGLGSCDALIAATTDPVLAPEAIRSLGYIAAKLVSLDLEALESCTRSVADKLTRLASSPRAETRTAVAAALAAIYEHDSHDRWAANALERLPTLASDPARAVRTAAAAALDKRVDDEIGVKIAAAVLAGHDDELRRGAIIALGKLDLARGVGVLGGTKKGYSFFGPFPAEGQRSLTLAAPRLSLVEQVIAEVQSSPSVPYVETLARLLWAVSSLREATSTGTFDRETVALAISIEDRCSELLSRGVDVLSKIASSADTAVLPAVIQALTPYADGYPQISAQLRQFAAAGAPEARAKAIAALVTLTEPTAEDARLVDAASRDSDAAVRSAAILVISVDSERSQDDVARILLEAALDANPDVSTAGVRGLTRARMLPQLEVVLTKAPSPAQRESTLDLLLLPSSSSSAVKEWAIERALADPDVAVREAAFRGADDIEHPGPALLEAMIAATKHATSDRPDSRIRSAAADAFGVMARKSDAAMPPLGLLLADVDPSVQYRAVLAVPDLGRRGRVFAPAVLRLLNDEDASMRTNAAKSLGAMRLAEPTVSEALVKALDDPDEQVVEAVIQALADLGPSTDLTARLVRFADVPNLREVAVNALENIRPPAERALVDVAENVKRTDAKTFTEHVAPALERVRRRLRPTTLQVTLATGATRAITVTDDTLVLSVATWCPYSKKLIEFLASDDVREYVHGLKVVYLFEDEWPTIRHKIQEELKESGVWSPEAENEQVQALRKSANGAPVFEPTVLSLCKGEVLIVKDIKGIVMDYTPKVFDHDTGTFDAHVTWRESQWFKRRMGMPNWLSSRLGDRWSALFGRR